MSAPTTTNGCYINTKTAGSRPADVAERAPAAAAGAVGTPGGRRLDLDLWVRRSCAAVVARVAADASFALGVIVSLTANIAAAPVLAWRPILVAGWPPLALLLAVELLAHRSLPLAATETRESNETKREDTATGETSPARTDDDADARPARRVASAGRNGETASPGEDEIVTGARSDRGGRSSARQGAEAVMWEHYQAEQAKGRTPTGAELDRVAGTNNYGSTVLARWRRTGRIPAVAEPRHASRSR